MHRFRFISTLTLAIMASCGPGSEAALDDGQPVGLLEYTATAPAGWEPSPTANAMRLAEFTIPSTGNEGSAEVVAYFFGPGQGGSVEANVQRWTTQFSDGDGGHPEPAIEQLADAVFPTTIVTLEGAYARTVGMGGAPADAVPGQMLVAAVVETPRGNLYVQLHGPAATVQAERAGFLAFIGTIRPQAASGATG